MVYRNRILIYDNKKENIDYKANAKFIFLKDYNEPVYYFSCDDDIIYPPDYVQITKKYIEKCRIVAAEPNPVLIKEIKNTFLNQDLIIEECAASNKNGEIDFYICLDDQMSSCNKDWLTVLRYKNAGIREKIKVSLATHLSIHHLIIKP